MKKTLNTLAAAGLSSVAVAGSGVWDEALMGDLSNDIASPTALGLLSLGTNEVSLAVEFSTQAGGDFDVFSFTIADGQSLAGLLLLDYASLDELAFLAIATGPAFPTDPNTGDITAFLGGALFGPSTGGVGTDYLPFLQLPQAGGVGFSGNLGPGTYSVFVQQTGLPTTATLGFVVVPAPATVGLLGLAGVAACRRRR